MKKFISAIASATTQVLTSQEILFWTEQEWGTFSPQKLFFGQCRVRIFSYHFSSDQVILLLDDNALTWWDVMFLENS
jgi:hypothetical protein